MAKISIPVSQGMSNYFLGDIMQVAIVTRNIRLQIDKLLNLGIGPWAIYTVDASNQTDFTYRGDALPSCSYRMGLCRIGDLTWEVIEPLDGPSIYHDFLEKGGDGVQHLAFNCRFEDYDSRVALLLERGYTIIQSGVFANSLRYHYFSTENDIGTVLEIAHFPKNFQLPPPDEIIPDPHH